MQSADRLWSPDWRSSPGSGLASQEPGRFRSGLGDRIIGEDRVDPLELLLGRGLSGHSVTDHVGLGLAPDLLGIDDAKPAG